MPKSSNKPKRALASTLENSTTPPSELEPQQTLAKVVKAEGNHLYSVILPKTKVDELGLETDADTEVSQSQHGSDQDLKLATGTEGSAAASTSQDSQQQQQHYLVELMPALRSTVFLRRNGYVLVDCDRELLGGRENKIVGIIVGVVLGGKTERQWRAMEYWPEEFEKVKAWDDSGSESEGPKMPESSSEEDDG